jgi:hypothetical protein
VYYNDSAEEKSAAEINSQKRNTGKREPGGMQFSESSGLK